MKGFSILLASSALFLGSSLAIAANPSTSFKSGWTCTTNASSSSMSGDQTADKQMNEVKKSLGEAFNFAKKHCRDCTKISCEHTS